MFLHVFHVLECFYMPLHVIAYCNKKNGRPIFWAPPPKKGELVLATSKKTPGLQTFNWKTRSHVTSPEPSVVSKSPGKYVNLFNFYELSQGILPGYGQVVNATDIIST